MDRKIDKAVALNFDPSNPSVPTVVATGRGVFAQRILDLAFEHGVKVREDPDLVEILQALDLGESIPPVAFAAVAEILLHVYRWEMRTENEHDQAT